MATRLCYSFCCIALDFGRSGWGQQLFHGPPNKSTLSQEWTYPVYTSVRLGILRPEQLLASSFGRFKRSDTKAMPNRTSEFRKESFGQPEKGWPPHPFPVGEQGATLTFNGNGVNAAFRCTAIQGDKIRDCADIRHSLTNRACAVLAPHQVGLVGSRSSNL